MHIMSGERSLTKDSRIIIVGAGVFGLSTTLHLLKRGYTNIHLFDRQPFHQNHYDETAGADGASCDVNKIIRASYGDQKLYQDLALQAMSEWTRWNDDLAATPPDQLPPVLNPTIPLWHNSGSLRLSDHGLEPKEEKTQKTLPASLHHTQYRISSAQRRADAHRHGIPATKLDPFDRLPRGLPVDGILDTTAGFVLASRACAWALHLCLRSGHVHTHFGPDHALTALAHPPPSATTTTTHVTGIITQTGHHHPAALVLIACGGWTPALIPETDSLLETTAGSVFSFQLPPSRPDLWRKYSAAHFPVWSWNMNSPFSSRAEGRLYGLYGLPRTPEGVVKVAFRGAKWTSYTGRSPRSGARVSVPRTAEEEEGEDDDDDGGAVPREALRVVRAFVRENLPELAGLELARARLCWYTDSVDNDFLIDHVPGVEGLVVASGGSGHGFKFLPVLGQHVVDVIERRETEYTRLFQWRAVPEGKRNGLEEGPEGPRTLDKQEMVGRREWREGQDVRL
jgi:sarcosine oxidase/L-pipecolate oxidase